MREVKIDESKWYCFGNPHNEDVSDYFDFYQDNVFLLDSDNNRCCLGFCLNQMAEFSDDQILWHRGPASLKVGVDLFSFFNNGYQNTKLSESAMLINDSETMPYEQKKKDLISLFKKHNVELTFYLPESE